MTEAIATETLSLDDGRERMKWANSYTALPTMLDLVWSMETWDWLTLLGEEWSRFDNIAQHADFLMEETPLADALSDLAWSRPLLMDADERAALDALPEVFTIWRGCYANNKWGLSWSLERDTAAKFPTLHRYRQDGQPLLVKAEVRRDAILALKLDRSETEVIAYRPKHISTSHITQI